MTARTFVDTNALIYAHDAQAGHKGEVATAALRTLWESGEGAVSVQVLQEFFVNALRKLHPPFPIAQLREILRVYRVWVRTPTSPDTVLRATEIMELASVSFWDSLIVAAAEEAGDGFLLTEDLQHGQTIAGVQVVNPFFG